MASSSLSLVSALLSPLLLLVLFSPFASAAPPSDTVTLLQNYTLPPINLRHSYSTRFSSNGDLYVFTTMSDGFNLARFSVYPTITLEASVLLPNNNTLLDFVLTPTSGYLFYCANGSYPYCPQPREASPEQDDADWYLPTGYLGEILSFDLETLEVNPIPVVTGLPTPIPIPFDTVHSVVYNEVTNKIVYVNLLQMAPNFFLLTSVDLTSHQFESIYPTVYGEYTNPTQLYSVDNTSFVAMSLLPASTTQTNCNVTWIDLQKYIIYFSASKTPSVGLGYSNACNLASMVDDTNSSRVLVVLLSQQQVSSTSELFNSYYTIYSVAGEGEGGGPPQAISYGFLLLNQFHSTLVGQGSNLWLPGATLLYEDKHNAMAPSSVLRIPTQQNEGMVQLGTAASLGSTTANNTFFYSTAACPSSPNLPVEYWNTVFVIQMTLNLVGFECSSYILQLQ
eukprot:TRINITY_DN9284_c0_g1_i1.p1 TRINITY_DN9284_c0_g1~~TRINITY_DN9284_c0_g1_i1.p1  ORF type:complete len:450 (+),score=86.36 TRINITY_DN9284_c0_g1_i1:99-1448(+)